MTNEYEVSAYLADEFTEIDAEVQKISLHVNLLRAFNAWLFISGAKRCSMIYS